MVTNLPRLPPKSDVSKLCLTSQITDSNSNNFDISISGSYLATFVTRPSPKMVWSYALSPQAEVTAMDSFEFEDLNHSATNSVDKKVFAMGITERNMHKLKLVSYGIEEGENSNTAEDENQSSTTSVINEEDKNTNEVETFKEVKDKSISIENQIVGLKFSKDSKHVFTVFSNGGISVWKFSVDSDDSQSPIFTYNNTSLANNDKTIIFHQFIQPEQLNVNSRSSKLDYLLITAETSQKQSSAIVIRIFSISSAEILEISNSTIENINNIDGINLTYDISGKLIILENKPELVIKAYDLPLTNNEQVIKIGGVFKHEPKNSPTSIMCASTNRILVTKGSTVALVDIKYEALLSSLDLYPRSKDVKGNAKPARNATLLNVSTVNGNTLKSKKTFALLVLKNTKENYSQIQHVSIDVGLGKLRDALISLPSDDNSNVEHFTSFPGYFSSADFSIESASAEDSGKEVEVLNTKILKNNEELSTVYQQLCEMKKSQNMKLLENSIVSYLKNKPVGELYNDDEFKVYEYEKDRFVDPKFFKLLTLLLFNYDPNTDSISLDEDSDNVLENGLTYVLTHPLFPTQYACGLLKVLEPFPRLLRQAVVTCANIPCSDFILELSNTENDEIFKDVITRLIEEFSAEEITQETIKIMKQKSESRKVSGFDLDKIINKIIKFNFGYEVLNSFIDSNGLILSLHYSNDESQLNQLIQQTQLKVDSLIQDTQLLTLINQCLTNAEANGTKKPAKKSSKKNKKKDKKPEMNSNGIQDIEVGVTKLDMMLKVGTPDKQSSTKSSKGNLSSYTIDRLII